MADAANTPNPSHIMQVGTGFFATKTLLSAVELGLFTELAGGPRTGAELQQALGLHPRATGDFLDALVALGFLQREGASIEGRYANSPDTDVFLDRNKPSYIGGLLEMCNDRLYGFWGNLTEGLKTGQAQNEAKGGVNPFEVLYADEAKLEGFLAAMSGIQMGPFMALAEVFDFSGVKTVCDAGGASGALCIALAREHAHLSLQSFDLPPVVPVARRRIAAAGLADRIEVLAGDFFADPLPRADVITMGNILHDWNEEKKLALLKAAYDALPQGGTFIAIENLIDDDRREAAFGLLMSLNMLIETGDGFDYSGAQFDGWCKQVGFARTEVRPLAGPTFAAIATK